MNERRIQLSALLAVAAAAWLALFFDPHARPNFSDFHVYWVAGGKAAQHLTVYDVQGHYQFKYSPFVALLWAAPTLIPRVYMWSRAHYLATLIGWYVLVFALAKALDARRKWALGFAACVVFTLAIRDELKLGQVNLWPCLLVLPAWFHGKRASTERGIDTLGLGIGAAWGLAIQWKLYALVFGPLWLLRRRPAVLAGMIGITALTLGGAMALVHGPAFAWDENLRWVRSLTASSEELLVSEYNVSLLGMLGKWAQGLGGSLGAWAYAIWIGAVALGLWALLLVRPREDERLPWFWGASFAWALVAVVNPLVWPYWQLLLIPLFLSYVADATANGLRRADPVFWSVIGFFTLMNWLQNGDFVHWGGGGLIATVCLMADAFRRRRRELAAGAAPERALQARDEDDARVELAESGAPSTSTGRF